MMKTALLSCFVLIFETLGQATLEFGLAVQMEHDTLWENGGSYFALLGLFAFVPYGATLRFLAYINERTRHDGWDVQVAFLRLGTQTAITPEASASQRRADTDAA